ncbi:gamma-aminobutyric acid receptor subunit alpha-6-like isoform X3 [Ruditapes philippinarum]|uniref:gamma-aminobutyric acid receptor subunit alpha-6-like isoform X3 n=1 Tax=Ruditapes philippinarum TaxID=129788 RepID=UPI00295AECF3|nr:gamma-aminobutyric acid receptor subunit alpha-6-like isoform X3 [Ruditapes philippinarum]
MMILLLFNFFRYAWSQFPTYAENTTDVLDKLLTGYRKEIRPGFGGPPLVIETDILIRSIGQISESDMDYSFQCYFRQRWTDERLQFDIRNISEVTLNNLFLENIWKPNTYFLNGQKSHQHNIPRPNLFVRIRSDGRVYLSRRLTVKAACPMKLNLYPMDRPICSLVLGSYGYTTDDIVYLWKYGNNISVEVNKDVRLAQFDLISVRSSNHTDNTVFGTFSVLKVYIYFERHLGFFVLQTYLPCSMITCLSWVSFWINRDAAPARVLLGVTTILATAGIGMTVREGLPRVSYATALDTYLNACVLYEMAAMIEYAAVNYFTKVLPVDGGVSSDEDEEEIVPLAPPDQSDTSNGQSVPLSDVQPTTEAFQGTTSHRKTRNRRKKESSFSNLFFKCLTGNLKYRTKLRERGNAEAGNSASNIDVWCRYLFPGTFLVFNVSYWICYLAIL